MKCLEIISLKETLIWIYDVGKNLQFNFCYLLTWFLFLCFWIFRFRGFISLILGTFNIFKVKLEFGRYQYVYVLEYIFLSIKFYRAFKLASNSANVFSIWIQLYKNIDFCLFILTCDNTRWFGFWVWVGFWYWLLFGYWVLVLSLNCLAAVVGGVIWLISGGYGWWQWVAKIEIGRETKF